MKAQTQLMPAKFGSVSTATLRTEDLLKAFSDELERQIRRNGEYFSQPENFAQRDGLNGIVEEANELFGEDGETIPEDKLDKAAEMVNETLLDALSQFAPAYSCFGSHPGDGADFGFWPEDIENIKEQVEFVSSHKQEYPAYDFEGEWLHVNERGNCTLYIREAGKDKEIWSIV